MYLVDTNIWLERLLEQEKSGEVKRFLSKVNPEKLFVSDFSLHSIALIMERLNNHEGFLKFLKDLFDRGAISLVRLDPMELVEVLKSMKKFKIDFDDGYQLECARKYDLVIVSFDSDFKRTDITAMAPSRI